MVCGLFVLPTDRLVGMPQCVSERAYHKDKGRCLVTNTAASPVASPRAFVASYVVQVLRLSVFDVCVSRNIYVSFRLGF